MPEIILVSVLGGAGAIAALVIALRHTFLFELHRHQGGPDR